MAPTKSAGEEPALKRLGGGRWQTRDERFTIEPQSGTWVVVDAEQTDDLGLALVRGPFRSLTEAKAGIDAARRSGPAESPLEGRTAGRTGRSNRQDADDAGETRPDRAGRPKATKRRAEPPPPPPEPRWIGDLSPADRRRARKAIERFEAAGIRDGEGIARRDLVGDVAAIAAAAINVQLAELVEAADDDPDAGRPEQLAEAIVEALADGQDAAFDVRWRLVDGAGRPIHLTAADLAAAIERTRTKRR